MTLASSAFTRAFDTVQGAPHFCASWSTMRWKMSACSAWLASALYWSLPTSGKVCFCCAAAAFCCDSALSSSACEMT